MRRHRIVLLLFVFAAGFLLGRISVPIAATGENATPPTYWPVVRVVDGDTLVVLYRPPVPVEEHVRLLGYDAPERGQPGFEEHTEALKRLAGNRVSLDFETPHNLPRRDKYGRLLAWLRTPAGRDVNAAMKKGLGIGD